MGKVTNIDNVKQLTLDRLDEIKSLVESGKVSGVAMAVCYKDGSTGNFWVTIDRPVTLIGELHCLMSDMEFYEVDLRKNEVE
jgi:hypothetical protein